MLLDIPVLRHLDWHEGKKLWRSGWTDALIDGVWIGLAVFALGWLEEHPFPAVAKYIGTEDIHFYAPPLVAIAITVFSANTIPALFKSVIGIITCTLSAVVVVKAMATAGQAAIVVRAVACGVSMAVMMLTGAVFPPAGALAALYVDNAETKGKLGSLYALMPGLTGTFILFLLAALKIEVTELWMTLTTPSKAAPKKAAGRDASPAPKSAAGKSMKKGN